MAAAAVKKRARPCSIDKDGLNPNQKIFAEHWLKHRNGSRAYLAAYPACSDAAAGACASRLLTEAKVSAYLERRKAEIIKELGVDSSYVLRNIKSIGERCMQAEPVYDTEGNPMLVSTPSGDLAPAYKFDASNALKANELLGKYNKLFTDMKEVNLTGHESLLEAMKQAGVIK
ncbi:terminase small subunit [Sphingomonas sp.]|uniref:terminase small subunit n=1 Tax=Sphingomonas sp. TaxID=28214 RepID=UPI003566F269